MKYADWIENVEPHLTPKGARLDLRLYVYEDGHGNINLRLPDDISGQPVNDSDEAVRIFRDLWEKAATVRQRNTAEQSSRLSSMLEQITPENIHQEIPDEGPVGHEIW